MIFDEFKYYRHTFYQRMACPYFIALLKITLY